MKREVMKVRLVLTLDVHRGRHWRELAPFRESVLFHFAPTALREQIVVLSEAIADQILEEVTEGPTLAEPRFRAHLRTLLTDLRHDKLSLREVVASYSEEMDSPKDRELSSFALRLAEHLESALAELDSLLGPAPQDHKT